MSTLPRGVLIHPREGDAFLTWERIADELKWEYGDNLSQVALFITSYLALLDDSPLTSESKKPASVYGKFIRTLTQRHVKDVVVGYSRLADSLLETMSDSSITGDFLPEFKDTPIFREYLTFWRDGDPQLLKFILSFLWFGKKLPYEDEEFHTTAFRGWLEVEERLATLELEEDDVRVLRAAVSYLLPPVSGDDVLLPKFGPGYVAERGVFGEDAKLINLRIHPKLSRAFGRGYGSMAFPAGFKRRSVPYWTDLSTDEIEPPARIKFVPKDLKKSRTICMEPNAFMFFQQEVWRWFYKAFRSGPLRNCVRLEDQTFNQEGAIFGSSGGGVDTIDLSAASDSVHVELVRRIFPRDWLYYMLATRTSRVELPDGSVRSVHKFAPMGSAVCFPTQCVIFSAVVLVCYWRQYVKFGSTPYDELTAPSVPSHAHFDLMMRRGVSHAWEPETNKLRQFAVYGDDIICDSRVIEDVISFLLRLGFSVNLSKSFKGRSPFRESCGMFSWMGHNVTPTLFKVPFSGKLEASSYAGLIDLANVCGDNSLRHVRTSLIEFLRHLMPRAQLPFVEDRSQFGIYVKKRRTAWRFRYSRDLPIVPGVYNSGSNWQTYEEKVLGVVPIRKRVAVSSLRSAYEYDQWMRSRIHGVDTKDFVHGPRIRPQVVRIGARWIHARYTI